MAEGSVSEFFRKIFFEKGRKNIDSAILKQGDFEIVKEIHPIQEKYFIEFSRGHIVNDKVADVIKEIIQNNGHPDREYLFCVKGTRTRYGNYPNPVKHQLDLVINKNRDKDNLLTVRDLRNVFATTLIHKGVNISFIQNLLSHKTPTMTARYAQMMSEAGGDEVKDVIGSMNL